MVRTKLTSGMESPQRLLSIVGHWANDAKPQTMRSFDTGGHDSPNAWPPGAYPRCDSPPGVRMQELCIRKPRGSPQPCWATLPALMRNSNEISWQAPANGAELNTCRPHPDGWGGARGISTCAPPEPAGRSKLLASVRTHAVMTHRHTHTHTHTQTHATTRT